MELDPDSLSDGTLRGQTVTTGAGYGYRTIGAADVAATGLKADRYMERQGTGPMDYAKMLLGQLGVLSGVPPYIWGAAPPDDQTERLLFHGQAKVNSFGRGGGAVGPAGQVHQ